MPEKFSPERWAAAFLEELDALLEDGPELFREFVDTTIEASKGSVGLTFDDFGPFELQVYFYDAKLRDAASVKPFETHREEVIRQAAVSIAEQLRRDAEGVPNPALLTCNLSAEASDPSLVNPGLAVVQGRKLSVRVTMAYSMRLCALQIKFEVLAGVVPLGQLV